MKYLIISILTLSVSEVYAQKLMLKPPKKIASVKSQTPPNTYRLSEKSDVVYAEIDNMPILVGQSPENMPNATLKMGKDTGSVYRMPNPLRREERANPKKP